jgi:hypothetical protein
MTNTPYPSVWIEPDGSWSIHRIEDGEEYVPRTALAKTEVERDAMAAKLHDVSSKLCDERDAAEAKLSKAREAMEMVRRTVDLEGSPEELAALDAALADLREVAPDDKFCDGDGWKTIPGGLRKICLGCRKCSDKEVTP